MSPQPSIADKSTVDSPFNAAMHSQPTAKEWTFFGAVTILGPQFCVLEPGAGECPCDPACDIRKQRRVAIKLAITSLGLDFTVEQDVLDYSPVWRDYTLPSLRAHQLDLRTLKGRHVQVRRVPTQETYVTGAGESRRETALVFVRVYLDRATGRAAATASFTRAGARGRTTAPPPLPVPTAIPAWQANITQRAFAEQALAVLWQASGEDQERFLALIAANPLLARYFGPDSPGGVDLIQSFPFSD